MTAFPPYTYYWKWCRGLSRRLAIYRW